MDIEYWKPVIGWEGYYEVSSKGRVRSLDRTVIYSNGYKHLHKGKILKQQIISNYCYVWLGIDGKGTYHRVHRLVAEAFIPNPENLPIVNHKDCNRLNNCVENLEWATYEYNSNYGDCPLKISKSKYKPVSQYTIDGVFIRSFESIKEASRITGINNAHIGEVCKNKLKQAGGYVWRFNN